MPHDQQRRSLAEHLEQNWFQPDKQVLVALSSRVSTGIPQGFAGPGEGTRDKGMMISPPFISLFFSEAVRS